MYSTWKISPKKIETCLHEMSQLRRQKEQVRTAIKIGMTSPKTRVQVDIFRGRVQRVEGSLLQEVTTETRHSVKGGSRAVGGHFLGAQSHQDVGGRHPDRVRADSQHTRIRNEMHMLVELQRNFNVQLIKTVLQIILNTVKCIKRFFFRCLEHQNANRTCKKEIISESSVFVTAGY